MPNDDFMLDVVGDGSVKNLQSGKESEIGGIEDDIDDFFDFVLIEKSELEAQMNQRLKNTNKPEKISKEE